jgi:hypothetical protein
MDARYTYDVESTELTDEEHRAFATAVQAVCKVDIQHALSIRLAMIKVPCGNSSADYIQRFARTMWQTTTTTPE